jgi:iron complex outermembrane receptor protein
MNRHMLYGSAAAVLAIIAAQPAIAGDIAAAAQDGSASSVAAPPATEAESGDIIVTAQRIAQPLQKVPVAVQVVSGSDLKNRKLNDLTQMQLVTPSLQTGSDNSYTLRGVGSLVVSPNVDSSVGIAIDDVSLGQPSFMNVLSFEDVSQVEILSGPQGLLFGRNASAGLLNVITTRPVIGEFSGQFYGEQDYRDTVPGGKWGTIVKGTVNIPISPIAALRINALYSDQDPLTETIARRDVGKFEPYEHRVGVKAKLLIEPADGLSIYIIGDYAERHGIGGIYDRTDRSFGAGSLTGIFAGLDGIKAGPDNLQNGTSSLYQDTKTGGASINISYALSSKLTLSDIAAFRTVRYKGNYDGDFTSFDGSDQNATNLKYNQYSNELRLALAPGALVDGQVGLYYFGSQSHIIGQVGAAAYGLNGPFDSFANPLIGQDVHSGLKSDSFAAFGQANIHPTSALTLILGARVTHDRLHDQLVQNQKIYPITLGPVNTSVNETVEHTDFSWKGGAQYQITDTVMAYATYSKGYKGPTFNDSLTTAGQDPAVGPEVVHSLDVGLKTSFFNRRLRVNIDAFRQIFDGIQVQGFDSHTSNFFTANGANAKSQGIEVQIDARPTKRLTLNLSATLLDAYLTSFTTDHCYPGQPGCSAAGITDSSGNRLPSSARFTSSVGATYKIPVSETADVVIAGDLYHRSSLNFSTNANPLTQLGAINILSGHIGIDIGDRFNLTFFCKNCTDKRFPIAIGQDNIDGVLANVNSSLQSFGYNSVRTIGISTNVKF